MSKQPPTPFSEQANEFGSPSPNRGNEGFTSNQNSFRHNAKDTVR